MGANDEARALHELGLDLAAQGRLDDAARAFHDATLLCPGYVDSHYDFARVLARAGRDDEALRAFERVLTLTPDFGQVHFERGVVLAKLGRRDDAVQAFRQALVFKPDDVYALNHLAIALQDLGELAEADRLLRRAIKIRPEMEDAYHNLTAILVRQQQWQEAAGILRQGTVAITEPEPLSRLYLGLGGVLWERDLTSEAQKALERAIAVDPGNLAARLTLGGLLTACRDFHGAVTVLRAAVDANPGNPLGHCALATALVGLGHTDDALHEFRRAIANDPECLSQDPDWRRSYEVAVAHRLDQL